MPLDIPAPEDLKRWRLALGLTQAEVARRAGVSQPLIARIERGSVDPRLSTLRAVVRAMQSAERDAVRLKDLMTAPVVTVRATDPVGKAVETMRHHSFSQVPVVHKGLPVGSVSERSIVRWLHEARDPQALSSMEVRTIMGPSFPMVDPDTPVDTVYGMLEEHPAVLVLERGRLIGLVARSNLLGLARRA
ncbi:MAG TPA: CBS domain-containing protein [Candidatus Thermoplasmatota archaeon]|jgi:predicted transcriptional regulator|nr:CBS domain-containing protein [Candidatus Thermoplasmatota archaeon]